MIRSCDASPIIIRHWEIILCVLGTFPGDYRRSIISKKNQTVIYRHSAGTCTCTKIAFMRNLPLITKSTCAHALKAMDMIISLHAWLKIANQNGQSDVRNILLDF